MKKVYLFAAMASVVLAGCSNNEEVKNPNELSVVAGIGSPSTRALITTSSFADGSKIALFVSGTGYTPALTTFTLGGTTWTPNAPIYLTGNTANVYGYYPSTASNSGIADANTTINATIYSKGTDVAPLEESFSGVGQTDYMWATPASATNLDPNTSNVVTLTFNHALTRIAFVINKDANYPTATGSGAITSIKLTNGGTQKFTTAGTFKVSDGTFTATTSTATSIEFTAASKTINAYNVTPLTTEVACGLVAPTTTALSSIGLQMTIDGKTMTAAGFPAAPSWEKGKSYTYTVTVSPTTLTVSSTVTVAAWTDGTPVTGIIAQ